MNRQAKTEYFTELYNQNFDYVYAYIFTRTAGNGQLTEEIVQETFTAAWTYFERFHGQSSYSTWLCAIAKKKLYESYRRTIYRERLEIPDHESVSMYASNFNLENMVIDQETQNHVVKILAGMNPFYRYVLIMKYIDGFSVKEIAKILGRTAKAVDGMLQRAKAAFEKAYLEREGVVRTYEG